MAKAFAALYALDLPVPIVLDGTAGLRTTWKYDAAADKWSELPDAPIHVERGGSVVSIHSAQTNHYCAFSHHHPILPGPWIGKEKEVRNQDRLL
jgi:hypothetical protein